MYFKSGLLGIISIGCFALSAHMPVKQVPENFKELIDSIRAGIFLICGLVAFVGALICWPDGGGK